jgi:hypothetical protein
MAASYTANARIFIPSGCEAGAVLKFCVAGGGRRRRFLVRAGRCIGDGLENDVVYGIMYLCVWFLSIIRGNI